MNRVINILGYYQRRHFLKCREIMCIIGLLLFSEINVYAYDFQAGGIYYNILEGNKVEVTSGGYKGEVIIPDYVTYNGIEYMVTSIGQSTFDGCSGLSSIIISEGITKIGTAAFQGCKSLKLINIPEGVFLISYAAFNNCNSLEEITFPNSLVYIGSPLTFNCKSLKTIKSNIRRPYDLDTGFPEEVYANAVLIVPNGKKMAYQSCKGWKNFVNIVEDVNTDALDNDVREIHVGKAGTLSNYISESDKYNIYGLTLSGELNGTDFRLLRDMAGHDYKDRFTVGKLRLLDLSNVSIIRGGERYLDTDTLTEEPYSSSGRSYGKDAFRFSVEESDRIPTYVFADCMLEEVSLPNNIISIDNYAFYGCRYLKRVLIPNSVKSIGKGVFLDCYALNSITIPNSVTSIGNSAFAYCRDLASIISEIVKPFEINEKVFSVYSTAILTVPNGTKSTYQSTAGWNKFTNVVEQQEDKIVQGDANGDKEVNVSDIVEVVNYIMDNPSAIFLKANADINGDGEVNVTDIVMMVNIIMSAQYSAARTKDNLVEDPTDGDCLILIEGGEGTLALNLENRGRYVASQFNLRLSNGQTLESITLNNDRLKEHKIVYKQINDNCYKVIIYSLSNKTFMGESGKLLNINVAGSGEVCIDNIFFVTKSCKEKHFGSLNSMTTGIINALSAEKVDVYGIDGRLVRKMASSTNGLAKGVYIINGKKHIVR